MRNFWSQLGELLLAVATFVGILFIAVKILELLFGKPGAKPCLRAVVREQDRRIEQLTNEKQELVSLNAELTEENAYLRKLLHRWSFVKDFCARLVARLLVESVKMTIGLVLKFA